MDAAATLPARGACLDRANARAVLVSEEPPAVDPLRVDPAVAVERADRPHPRDVTSREPRVTVEMSYTGTLRWASQAAI